MICMELRLSSEIVGNLWWVSVACVGYSCISGCFVVRWDLWEPLGQGRRVLTCTLRRLALVLCGTGDEVHLLHYRDVLWVSCGVE